MARKSRLKEWVVQVGMSEFTLRAVHIHTAVHKALDEMTQLKPSWKAPVVKKGQKYTPFYWVVSRKELYECPFCLRTVLSPCKNEIQSSQACETMK
jgi:hypothetical protein